MASGNRISAISYSTLLLAFLLIISNVECRVNPSVVGTTAVTTITCEKVYGAQISDTCSGIVQNFGLTVDTFSGLNPNLNCDKIFVGQWLCIFGAFGN